MVREVSDGCEGARCVSDERVTDVCEWHLYIMNGVSTLLIRKSILSAVPYPLKRNCVCVCECTYV